MNIQYVTNKAGKPTAVQIPLKQWEEIQFELKKLELFDDLTQAFKEMSQHESGALQTPTTEELFSQL